MTGSLGYSSFLQERPISIREEIKKEIIFAFMSRENTLENLKTRIVNLTEDQFENLSLEIFHYQYQNNEIYHRYVNLLGKDIEKISQLTDIPFLPIEFFKRFEIKSGSWHSEAIFTSSSTGGVPSSHHVKDLSWYREIARFCFQYFFGSLEDWTFYALLPSYMERKGSSLVQMMHDFMLLSGQKETYFYLHEYDLFIEKLKQEKEKSVFVMGVSFALLDLADRFDSRLTGPIYFCETGGMKGKRKEILREELHEILTKNISQQPILSEYGMTELLSQAYAKEHGIFETPPTMQVFIRDSTDPFHFLENNRHGALNIIDLANIDSCSFIATDDIGMKLSKNQFKVLGRLDHAEQRGCNLMVY